MKTPILILVLCLLPAFHSSAQETASTKERVRILLDSEGLRFEIEMVDNQPTLCRLEGRALTIDHQKGGNFVASNAAGQPVIQVLRDQVVPSATQLGELKLGIKVTQPMPLVCEQLKILGEHSLVVTEVATGSLAARSGLKLHDIIVSLDDTHSASEQQLARKLKAIQPGATLTLQILRAGESRDIAITAERQSWVVAQSVPFLKDLPLLEQVRADLDKTRIKWPTAAEPEPVAEAKDAVSAAQAQHEELVALQTMGGRGNKILLDEMLRLSQRLAKLESLMTELLESQRIK